MNQTEYKKMYEVEGLNWWFVGKRMLIGTILDKARLGKKGKIVDVGCGTGGATVFLKKYGTVVGVETNGEAIKLSRSRDLEVVSGSANRLPFADNSADLVTMIDVLYHKGVEDTTALREAKRVLRKGGQILVTDSAVPMLFSSHDEVMDARQRYTKKEMVEKIEKAGFEVKKASYMFFLTFPLFVVQRVVMKILPISESKLETIDFANKILLGAMKLESWLLGKWNLPIGSSIIVYAMKN